MVILYASFLSLSLYLCLSAKHILTKIIQLSSETETLFPLKAISSLKLVTKVNDYKTKLPPEKTKQAPSEHRNTSSFLLRYHHLPQTREHLPLDRATLYLLPVDRHVAVRAGRLNPERRHRHHLNIFVRLQRQMRATAQPQQKRKQLRPGNARPYDQQPNDTIVQPRLGRKVALRAEVRLVGGVHHHKLPGNRLPAVRDGRRQRRQPRRWSVHLHVRCRATVGAALRRIVVRSLVALVHTVHRGEVGAFARRRRVPAVDARPERVQIGAGFERQHVAKVCITGVAAAVRTILSAQPRPAVATVERGVVADAVLQRTDATASPVQPFAAGPADGADEGGQVGHLALVRAQADQPVDGPDGEPLPADGTQPLAFDVNVRDETPADRQEREHDLQQKIKPKRGQVV